MPCSRVYRFRNCTSLTQITIPDGVISIGSNAFQNCSSLTQVLIPNSVKRIDTHAFFGCSSLTQITLHDNIDRIHALAFYGCSATRYCSPDSHTALALTDVGYSFSSQEYPHLSLKAYENNAGMCTFTVDRCDESAVSVSFPNHVSALEGYAFFNCTALTEVILPDGITEIPYSAFSNRTSLRKITIPGSVTQIADDAFTGCSDPTIFAPDGSAGQAFARANGFSWQPL